MKRLIPTFISRKDIELICFWLGVTALSAITIITIISGVILFTQNVQP